MQKRFCLRVVFLKKQQDTWIRLSIEIARIKCKGGGKLLRGKLRLFSGPEALALYGHVTALAVRANRYLIVQRRNQIRSAQIGREGSTSSCKTIWSSRHLEQEVGWIAECRQLPRIISKHCADISLHKDGYILHLSMDAQRCCSVYKSTHQIS